ncbi:MAG: MBL fold metallo-hydrolase [Bdellovibrio sp.]|nr:MBL fold metallo-hydrolase [Bdellovibrio sp.]
MSNLPKHLAQDSATGFAHNEPVSQYEIGSYRNFVYLIVDWKMRLAAIVDPQEDLSEILRDLKENQIQLKEILLTHTHHDHIAGVPELLSTFSELKVTVHAQDQHRLNEGKIPQNRIKNIRDGEIIELGETRLKALHTPGHSAGELCYFLTDPQPYLLTGDTVFIRDCGRTDLGTGSNSEMFHSIQKIKTLPQETIFLPGHHYQKECATTLMRELRESPPFGCTSVEELAALP